MKPGKKNSQVKVDKAVREPQLCGDYVAKSRKYTGFGFSFKMLVSP